MVREIHKKSFLLTSIASDVPSKIFLKIIDDSRSPLKKIVKISSLQPLDLLKISCQYESDTLCFIKSPIFFTFPTLTSSLAFFYATQNNFFIL